MAYVLGYFAADGSMLRNKRGGCYVEFTTTDLCLLNHLRRATGAEQRISKRLMKNDAWRQQYRIQIGSKSWYEDLLALGFTQAKSNTLRLPKLDSRYVADFVRGYFDGDGCIYFRKLKFADREDPRWILQSLFTSGSKGFLESLWKLLKEYGIGGGTIQNKKRGFELKFSHKDSIALYGLMYHNGSITELYLPRKHKLFEKALKTLYKNAVVA